MEKSNDAFYKGTALENRVPHRDVGTPLSTDEQVDALKETLEIEDMLEGCNEPELLHELGTDMSGELFRIDAELREAALEHDVKIGDEHVAFVFWSRYDAANGETAETVHMLTQYELDKLDNRCLGRLIDRIAAAGDAAERDGAIERLVEEWNRRRP